MERIAGNKEIGVLKSSKESSVLRSPRPDRQAKAYTEAPNVSEFDLLARQLVPFIEKNTLIFASLEGEKFRKLQLLVVVKKLKDMGLFEAVDSVNYLPHPSFVRVKFDSEQNAEKFKSAVSQIEGQSIRFVSKEDYMNTCFITVANLPADLILQLLGPQLSQWGQIIKIIPQLIPKENGGHMQVGSTRFEFKLKDGITIFDLPYFIKIFSFKVYLYIRDRPKICFRCSSREHLVSSCNLRFCGVCRSLKLAGHQCVPSYASVAGSSSGSSVLPLIHDRILEQLSDTLVEESSVIEEWVGESNHVDVPGSLISSDVEIEGECNLGVQVSRGVDAGVSSLPRPIRTRQYTKLEAIADKKRALFESQQPGATLVSAENPKGTKKVKKHKSSSVAADSVTLPAVHNINSEVVELSVMQQEKPDPDVWFSPEEGSTVQSDDVPLDPLQASFSQNGEVQGGNVVEEVAAILTKKKPS